jgi:Tol biopolymer transport system component
MKKETCIFGTIFLTVFCMISCVKQSGFPVLKGSYLGQKLPGDAPELFAPGIVSTGFDELCSLFSPDGNNFVFCIQMPTHVHHTMLVMKMENGRWTAPEVLPFSGEFSDADPAFTPDGKKLFFASSHPMASVEKTVDDYDICYVEKTDNGWSELKNAGAPINSKSFDTYPSFTNEGTLYFTSTREGGIGKGDIYYSKFISGKFLEPVNLGHPVNSEKTEEGMISPDESFVIFTSERSECYGGFDLYVSFRNKNGKWTEPVNLGENINSNEHDYCPYLSPDGKYLFFTSFRKDKSVTSKALAAYKSIKDYYNTPGNGNGDIYWVSAKIIEDLKPDELK